jgi:predicted nucleic acid-binding protein
MWENVFMDASAWVALYDADDGNHTVAIAKQRRLREEKALIYTSDYIFDEAITRIRYSVGHSSAVRLGELILSSRIINLINVSTEIRDAAWQMFCRYHDKQWSFILFTVLNDCFPELQEHLYPACQPTVA